MNRTMQKIADAITVLMISFEKSDFRHNLRQKLFPQFLRIIFEIKEIMFPKVYDITSLRTKS